MKIIQITKYKVDDDLEEFYNYQDAEEHLQVLKISKQLLKSPDYRNGMGIKEITEWFIKNFTLTPKN
jgi:hypothetical protein